ncbi:MAG: hypothetical protein EOM30_05390 [Clostridia bacterium]|nr:hypothetical protein [Clostridia bacterium]NLS84481.1 PH domain-containing protein [Oscillospiraceae bacterium]
MTRAGKTQRFHPVFALRYVKYGLVACLIPMAQALLSWDLDALFIALWQDLYILIAFTAAAAVLWYTTSFTVEDEAVRIRQGVFVKKQYLFRTQSIAVLEITRPFFYRIVGASRLTMYFKQQAVPRKFSLYLPKKAAQKTADMLMPVHTDSSVFSPMGYERIAFIMLSANIVTAVFFISMTLKHASDILGTDIKEVAQTNFAYIISFLQKFLPMGLAAVMGTAFVLLSLTFLYSFVHTAGFRVCRNGGVIIMRGGLLSKTERRIYVQSISACNMRVTPAARLLRRVPVYISAGSFSGGDMPLMAVKHGSEAMLEALLPMYEAPKKALCEPKRKSIASYLWKPGTIFALSLMLLGAAMANMPSMLPVICVPALLSGACMAVSYEGYLREGVCKNENRTLSLVYTRFFTRHEVCIFTPDTSYTIREHPFAISGGWCDFYVSMPGSITLRARCVARYVADRVPFLI